MSNGQITIEITGAYDLAVQSFLRAKKALIEHGRIKDGELDEACWRFIRFVASALRCSGVDPLVVRVRSGDDEPLPVVRELDLETARKCLELSDGRRRKAWTLGGPRLRPVLALLVEAMFAADDLILACERPWDSGLPATWFTRGDVLGNQSPR